MNRHGNTAQEIKYDGAWGKVGRKHYRHISGIEVKYDHNAWGWRVDGEKGVYKALYAAKYIAERAAV